MGGKKRGGRRRGSGGELEARSARDLDGEGVDASMWKLPRCLGSLRTPWELPACVNELGREIQCFRSCSQPPLSELLLTCPSSPSLFSRRPTSLQQDLDRKPVRPLSSQR